jgi:hypothetical protein
LKQPSIPRFHNSTVPQFHNYTISQLTNNSMYSFYFEKLEVWHLSRELTKSIYKLTDSFPVEERYGLISQIRRASVSIANNLAEGSARKTQKDHRLLWQFA